MSKKSIRFSVTDGKGNRAATWKCSAAMAPKNDVYLFCREIGSALKVSLHESGDWHFAFNQHFFNKNFDEIDKGRFIEKWTKPPEIAPGVILGLRIIVPWGSVRTPIEENIQRIHWVQKPPDGYAIEFYLLITSRGTDTNAWPGKNGMNAKLVGSFQLSNGDTVWIIYQEILMPNIQKQTISLKYFKGRNKNSLRSNNLRMHALNIAEDGSRVLYDFCVQYKKKVT